MSIDFAMLKRKLSIERVLKEYRMLEHLRNNAGKMYGPCPVHLGDNPRAFNADLEKNLWNCFTHCGGGSVIDLIMAIENVNAYEAARMGCEMLGITVEAVRGSEKSKQVCSELSLDAEHPYLTERNVDIETAQYFGIGFCSKGKMAGRLAIPIHDEHDRLVAYCGRTTQALEPKYLFPKGFPKNRIVYNLNRAKKSSKNEVVIVEGFFDVYALHKAGIESVAIMGSSMSLDQKRQIVSLEKRISLMLDGDAVGRKGMERAVRLLQERKPIKAIYLPDPMQPEDLTANYLRRVFS